MSYVLLNMAMKSVTLSIIQAECMSPGHTTENPAITASSHSIFKQKKVSPQNSSDESNAVSVRVEK